MPSGEKVKPQHGIVLVLLIGLIAGAAAAGDLPPALPHEFYGNVAIDGSPAPAGTVVTAMIGGTACGSVEVTSPGRYGDPDWNLGNRLLVTGTEGQNGETITFLVDGGAADQTAPFTPGRVTRLDLSFEETVTVPTARFTANVTSGPAPLAVRFADASTGDPDSWFWDFGDGENSAERSPTHTYTTPGTYTANLTVANAAGSNSATAAIIVQEAGAVEIVRGPYFTGTTTTSTFVNWMTQEPVAGTVEYADDAYYAANGGYALSVADTAETAFHRVALEDLTPGTLYHYRIVAGNTTLGDRTFRTFPEDGGFTFIVYGDTQLPANIKIVADRIADEDPLFILHTGDQVSAVESVDEWNNFFSSNRRLLANTTIYTTLGNHEYNDTVYYETFGLPQWYSFVCADARFAVLDDNFNSNPLSETAWLARDLANDTAWKFVANHHPPYSSTSDRAGGWLYPRAWWGQIMQDNGVTAVFNGHVHAYERYIVDGITYLVTGTGAGSLHPLGPANERPAGYQNSLVHTLGYTKITVHDNGTATGQFVQVARLDPNNSSQVLEVYPPGTAFETYTLTPRARGADLAAVSLDVPAGIVAGNACTVNGTVENLGGTVAGACPVTLAADGDLIGNLTVDPLAPGETAEVSFTWTPAAAGEAVLTLSVDPASTVPDIDRTNNVRTVTVTVTEPGAPVANFTANVTAGDAPLAVQFTDASTGGPTSWSWTFGDGGTSDQQNPVHVYTAAGVYTVNLTVTNDFGSDSEVKTGYITVTEPEPGEDAPVADFTANITSGELPLAVQFTDASTGAASWAWNFGDGATSAEQNPVHVYTAAGVYTVNLTVENDYGASSKLTEITVTKPDPIVFNASVVVYSDEPIVVDSVTYGGSTFFNILAAAGYTYTYAESDAGYTDRKPLLTLTIDGVTYPTKDFGPDYAWKFYETLGTGDDYKYKKALNGYIKQSGTYYIWFGDTSQFGSWDLPTVENSIYVVELTVDLQPARSGAPVADFTANVTAGEAPLAVQFTDLSTNATAWAWNSGDVATSAEQNPVHTYTAAGVYTVNLTVTNDFGSDTEVKTNYITVTEPDTPVADFTGTPTTGDAPLEVRFADNSTGKPVQWLWEFGDGRIATTKNPITTYRQPDTYTVNLTATYGDGSSSRSTKADYITVTRPNPVASFTADQASGNADLPVQFTDTSTGSPTSWSWNFGDGATSTDQNPAHTYTTAGTYTVTLEVSRDGGPASTKTEQIDVKPVAGFTAGTTRGYAPFAVQFTDASTGNPDTHSWDFGDGATSSDPNPAHTYTTAGTYTVALTVTGGGQAHTEVKAAYITAVDPGVPPTAEFRADTTGGYAPLVVRFFHQSQGDVDEWLWNFGDGATSAGQNPEHAYTAAGTYTVTLTVQKAGAQSDTRTKAAYVTVDDPKPVADFTVTRLRGEAPLTVQFTDNSTGAPPLTRAWDFGDGTNSTLRNPTHVFDHDGEGARTYTVTLTVTNSGGSDVKTTAITVVAPPQKEDVTDRVDQTNATATEDIPLTYQGLTLEIPKGHEAKQANGSPITEFSVGVAPDLEEPPAGTIEIGGKAFKLGPEGAKFNPKIPITITFTQDEWEELFGDGRTTKLQRYDGQNWIELENQTRDDTTFTITGYTDSFSVFAPVTTTTTPEPTSTPTQPRTSGSGSSTATVTSTGTADLLTASWGGVLRPYLVYVDGKFAHLSLETGVTALDDAGSPLSGVGIAPVSTLPGASSLAFSGYAVDCSPAGATFSPAIDLVFTFTGDEWAALLGKTGGDSARLVVQGYDDATGTWTACPTNVDADARTVTASVSHFSTYVLFIGTATKVPVTTGPTPTVPAAAATTAPVPPAETGESPLVWIALAVVIVAALAGYLLWKRR